MAEQLDDDHLAQLRLWAETLLQDEQSELRAAGRGILMLVDEVERLRARSRVAFADEIGTALADRLGGAAGAEKPDPRS